MTLTLYDQVGGADGLRRLVDRFYTLMDTLPEAWDVRRLHADDLSNSSEKLFMFLSGWLGGPPLYIERFGHPRLRARHLPFSIGARERDQWMLCMREAMLSQLADEALRTNLLGALGALADHMRNRAEPETATAA